MKKLIEKMTLADKYILKQLAETFVLGVVVFTALVFASDQFLYLVRQMDQYGVPFGIAVKTVILQLPFIIVFTIPMGILLATILTFNKLSTNSELTVMRACGISLTRLAVPVLAFSFSMAAFSFFISEFIVPAANMKAKELMMEAISQKNLPNGKTNFSFKELDKNKQIKRLFYINKYEDRKLDGITVLDFSNPDLVQVLQSNFGMATPEYWWFDSGMLYTISGSEKVLNTATFYDMKLFTDFDLSQIQKGYQARELNFFQLAKYIKEVAKENKSEKLALLKVMLYEKVSVPITTFLIALIGIPLAISPPRAKVNRGLLFSIIIIFFYYILRAISVSLGEAEMITPFIAAWLPNFIVLILGSYLFYRKAYLI